MIIGLSGYIGSGKDTLAKMIQIAISNYIKFGEHSHPNDIDLSLFSGPVPGNWKVKKFADPLKEIVCILIGCKRSDLEDQEFKKTELGPEWNRTIKDARDFLSLKFSFTSTQDRDDSEVIKWATNAGFKWTRTVREMLQEIGTDLFREKFSANTWVNATMSQYLIARKTIYGDTVKEAFPNWIVSDMRFPDELTAIKERSGLLIRINRGPCVSNHSSEVSLDKYLAWDHVVENTSDLIQLYEQAKLIVTKFNLLDYE